MTVFLAPAALLADGWHDTVAIEVDAAGTITGVRPDATPSGADRLSGPIIPGIPNAHSHAFQRAMAGAAERRTAAADSFWTWREQMYRVALRIGPEALQAVAAQLFVELLKRGYTSVAEFHYLHRDPAGNEYADPAELSRRVLAAAAETGMRLTLLPVIYAHAGFGARPLQEDQRRFRADLDWVHQLVEAVRPELQRHGFGWGVAPHSLRAVTTDMLRHIPAAFPQCPIHIHVAEQQPEVEAAVAATGRRPIELLADSVALDARWNLVHATHATPDELGMVARSGAVAVLCPTTEANLGDGIFDLPTLQSAGGRIAIGSDSNICADPAEELRWLEYGQRLARQARCVAGTGSIGRSLLDATLAGGAQALGLPIGRLDTGYRADWCVLAPEAGALLETGDDLADQFIFAPRGSMIRDVFVGGRQIIADGHHPKEIAIAEQFTRTIAAL